MEKEITIKAFDLVEIVYAAELYFKQLNNTTKENWIKEEKRAIKIKKQLGDIIEENNNIKLNIKCASIQ